MWISPWQFNHLTVSLKADYINDIFNYSTWNKNKPSIKRYTVCREKMGEINNHYNAYKKLEIISTKVYIWIFLGEV